MRSDDNWKATRDLTEDLEDLTGIPKEVSEDLLMIIENLIIHKFIEAVADKDYDGKGCCIVLPYLGSLDIVTDDRNQISLNFIPRNSFTRKIKSAYYNQESPLVVQCAKILGEDLVNKFKEGSDIYE